VIVDPAPLNLITHDTSGARVMRSVEEVPDVRGLGGQRKRIPHGNMRAKLPNYIGQVFECKADRPHSSRKVLANWWGEARQARFGVRSSGFEVPKPLNFGPRTLGRLAHIA
jgi:hypothetical protein